MLTSVVCCLFGSSCASWGGPFSSIVNLGSVCVATKQCPELLRNTTKQAMPRRYARLHSSKVEQKGNLKSLNTCGKHKRCAFRHYGHGPDLLRSALSPSPGYVISTGSINLREIRLRLYERSTKTKSTYVIYVNTAIDISSNITITAVNNKFPPSINANQSRDENVQDS